MIYGVAGTEMIPVTLVWTGCVSSFLMTAGDGLREGQVTFWRLLGELKQAGSFSSAEAVVSSQVPNS